MKSDGKLYHIIILIDSRLKKTHYFFPSFLHDKFEKKKKKKKGGGGGGGEGFQPLSSAI